MAGFSQILRHDRRTVDSLLLFAARIVLQIALTWARAGFRLRSCICDIFGEEHLMSRIRRIAPWLLLGPISGPLAKGFCRSLRRGERVLAGLYLVAMTATWFDLFLFGKQALEAF
jgi:hypothetical protein